MIIVETIQYTILAACILFYMHDKLIESRAVFDEEAEIIENYIMQVDRNVIDDVIRANYMVHFIFKKANDRYRRRIANQLIILWRARFKDLFK